MRDISPGQHAAHRRISTAGIARRADLYFLARRIPGTSIGESWEFPGGKNRTGESPEQTLVREFAEEFSAGITVGKLLYAGSFFNRDIEYDLRAYEVKLITDDPGLKLTEHLEYGWKTLDEIADLPMAESDRQIYRALQEQLAGHR